MRQSPRTSHSLCSEVHCPPVHINQTAIRQAETVKYLGLLFDKRLTWKCHVAKTQKHLDLKTREIYWLTGKLSPLSLTNKLLIYKAVLKPVWNLGMCCSVQYSYHSAGPVKTTLLNNQRPMVCHKPNSSSGPTHPTRSHGFTRTVSCTSQDTELTPQPPHASATRPAKQQVLEKKMAIG
jgi:hypothetical protein